MNATASRKATRRPTGPPLGVVEVWSVPLDPADHVLARLTAPLEAHERAHARRLRAGGDAWAASRGALRLILALHLEQPAESLRFRLAAGGKPELASASHLRFNLSHAEGLALVAVASDRDVGVDLERENEHTDIEALTREVLPLVEAVAVRAAAHEERRAAFFAAWTRHEARMKLAGRTLASAEPAETPEPGALVVVRALAAWPGYAAAVAAEGGSWSVRLREISEAL